MSEEATPAAKISTAKNKNGSNITLHSWFVNKLGTTLGDNMFKELVTFVDSSVQSLPGTPGIVLDTKGGRIVSLQQLN